MFAEHKLRRGSPAIDLEFSYNGITEHLNPFESVHTFSNVDIGTPNDNRIVCVLLAEYKALINEVVNSVTIGGVTANLFREVTDNVGNNNAIAWLKVPTGTTTTVVMSLNASARESHCFSYSFNLFNDIPIDTVKGSAGGASQTIEDVECVKGGVVLALWTKFADSSIPPTPSWTGIDSVSSDEYGNFGVFLEFSSYSILTTEDSTVNDFTVTSPSQSGKHTLMAISFGEP